MFPPPITMPTSTPNLTMSRTSWAICSSVFGEIPYFPSPISASPLSFRRMRLNLGGLVDAVTGRGSYLAPPGRSEEHTSELQSRLHLVCRLLLEKKKKEKKQQLPSLRITRCRVSDSGKPHAPTR